jgi:transcriptional antiterminator NusG
MTDSQKLYAAQVLTGQEEKFINRFSRLHRGNENIFLYFPKRELEERKGGRVRKITKAVFSGYIFISVSGDDSIHRYGRLLRQTEGFFKFLKTNSEITELSGRDKEIVMTFLSLPDETVGASTVYFNEHDKIVVVNGVLKGLEGQIVKVNRRKGRAKVRVKFFNDDMLIDFPIKELGRVS